MRGPVAGVRRDVGDPDDMRTVYEKGNKRKLQYAQNDDGAWFARQIGGKLTASRWGRCRAGSTPDLTGFTARELEIRLPSGATET